MDLLPIGAVADLGRAQITTAPPTQKPTGGRVNIKIVSDGTALGTRVVNAETGEAVDGVTAIRWSVDWKSGQVRAIVEYTAVPVELVAHTSDPRQVHANDSRQARPT